MARRFAEREIKPNAAELDEKREHPAEIVKQLGGLKMMGIAVPEEYGGGGRDNVSYALALVEVSKACASTGVIILRYVPTFANCKADATINRISSKLSCIL